MNTITLKMSDKQIKDLEYKYRSYKKRNDIQYTHFQIKGSDVVITAYTSGKVVFSGEGAEYHASFYSDIIPKKETKSQSQVKNIAMAGSDEVGTGDYFGPIIVCAAIVEEEDYKHLPLDLIADTKQMNDELVRKIAPVIAKQLKYSLLILDNKKYNEIHKTQNMNVIKAKLHNKAFVNLESRYEMPSLCVIDQFLAAPSYYKHLANEAQVFRNLTFETKAENKFIAVACAAILARNAFLDVFDKFEAHYEMPFPKGAGKKVDEFAIEFVDKFGDDALYDVAKVHFINTERVIGRSLE